MTDTSSPPPPRLPIPIKPSSDPALTPDATMPINPSMIGGISGIVPPRRGRGRPPGSKNKPKMDPTTGQLSGGPTAPGTPTPTQAQLDAEKKRKLDAKKAKADEWAKRIVTDGNEYIMSLLMTQGVPGALLYKQIPIAEVVNPNYTPIANKVAIQPSLAKLLGATLAELETSDAGSKLAAVAMEDSPIRLGFLCVASGLMLAKHLKEVMEVRKDIGPYVQRYHEEMRRREDAAKNQATNSAGQTGYNPA